MTLSETQAGRRPRDGVGIPSTNSGFPPITQTAFSTCRAHYPGGSVRCCRLIYSALPRRVSSRTALTFPERRAGRHPHLSFRGLLKLHSRYGLRICSPTLQWTLSRGSRPPVTRRNGPSAIQSYRQLLEWDFHPLVVCAIRAHLRFAHSRNCHSRRAQQPALPRRTSRLRPRSPLAREC
jgi:hypothetical protein